MQSKAAVRACGLDMRSFVRRSGPASGAGRRRSIPGSAKGCNPQTDLLTINGEFTASLVIVRCNKTNAGFLRWNIRFDMSLKPDITIADRMDRPNLRPLDYYLLPSLDIILPRIRLAEHNGLSLEAYRLECPI